MQNMWQQSWSDLANQNNKLFTIKPGPEHFPEHDFMLKERFRAQL